MTKPQANLPTKSQDAPHPSPPAKQKNKNTMTSNSGLSSEWDNWALADHGQYYFRGRSISSSEIASIPGTLRNSIVCDNHGRYTLYEFMSLAEAQFYNQSVAQTLVSQAPEQVAPPTAAPVPVGEEEQPQQHDEAQGHDDSHLQVPEHSDDEVNSGYTSAASGVSSNVQIIEFEHTKRGVNINFPKISQDHSIVLDKKTKKKIKADKKKKVPYRPKVVTWMDDTSSYSHYH